MGELGQAKVSRFSNEFRDPVVCIDSLIYKGLAFGSNCKDCQTQMQTDKLAKKQISTAEMSPPGDVAMATCSARHNVKQVIQKKVSL